MCQNAVNKSNAIHPVKWLMFLQMEYTETNCLVTNRQCKRFPCSFSRKMKNEWADHWVSWRSSHFQQQSVWEGLGDASRDTLLGCEKTNCAEVFTVFLKASTSYVSQSDRRQFSFSHSNCNVTRSDDGVKPVCLLAYSLLCRRDWDWELSSTIAFGWQHKVLKNGKVCCN